MKDWNEAVAYMEARLTGDIDVKKAAAAAGCSEFHFRRMFSMLAGIPLSEYIRRRRMTLAAAELIQTGMRVIDAAAKYGYDSSDAFTRAFRSVHGVTPSAVQRESVSIRSYPRIHIQLQITGGDAMNWRIEEKPAFRLIGKMERVPIVFEGENEHISAMWKKMTQEEMAQLQALSDMEPSGIIQATADFSEGRMEEEGDVSHYIGVVSSRKAPEPFSEREVPAGTWAVFTAKGSFPEALQETWGRIYSEWFPSSGYEQTGGPEMLWSEQEDTTDPAFHSEIWIPVIYNGKE
ncbi:AraC family transcriptional regulator [Alkalicoccus chagannorensis]|uniref:AraC family transcriptional regulator n=1 Tax=Alkalicoccus chagannorensis TaxID=427072 RepID=UPI000403FC37|nr:AraC family transcriptional regulator [Alkalicoccus chagannorensis]